MKKNIMSALLRSCGALLSFFLGVFITRSFDHDISAQFFYFYNLITLSAVIGLFGLNTLIIKLTSSCKTKDNNNVVTLVFKSTILIFMSSLVIALFIFTFQNYILKYAFESYFIIFLFIFIINILAIIGSFFQGCFKISTSIVLVNVFPFIFFFVAVYLFKEDVTSGESLIYIFGFSFLISACIAIFMFLLKIDLPSLKLKNSLHGILGQSKFFYITQISQLGLFSAMPLVAAVNLQSGDIAVFYATIRVAAIISFVLVVFNLITTPRISYIFISESKYTLHQYIKKTTYLIASITFPILCLIFLFSDIIMGMYGPDYESASTILRVIIVGYMIVSFTGQIGALMTMANLERELALINFLIVPFSLISAYLIPGRFGLLGIACLFSFVMVIQNILGLMYIRKKLGFYTFI